ncbi:hypothetical protein BC332_33627 [Capsicum chinense]|nr:hypothetical protein BC332_33627 [Capsicum chinense]
MATVVVKNSVEPNKNGKLCTLNKAKDYEKYKEEKKEKQVAVISVVKEDIVKGDKYDFQSMYPHLAASFECLGGMLMIYQNGVSWLKEKMSLVTSDKAKVLEEK